MRWSWIVLLGACATPTAVDWPPLEGEPRRRIVVSIDAWHAMIAIPREGGYEEWGFAEKAWYYEKKQGVSGALRALFSVSDGLIEIARADRPWADRTPNPPAIRFDIFLTEMGYARLLRYLQQSRGRELEREDERTWYDSTRYYTGTHNCQHWAAGALRAAGLPLAPSRCFTAGALKHQLQSALGGD